MMRAVISVSHMAFDQILMDIDGDGIALLTINRPSKLNALNQTVLRELGEAFTEVETSPEIRGLILTGAGEKAFVAGADIAELVELDALATTAKGLNGQAIMRNLEKSGKPSIAAINGFALGGGLELALCCTLRVASGNAKMGLPEVKLGVIPGYGGTQRLPRLVGRGKALEMMLTGEPVDAAEAHRLGLVNHVVDQAELIAFSKKLMARILANGPVAIRLAMQAVDIGQSCGLEEGLRHEATAFGLAAASDDRREGTRAFLEKRQARFTGK